eukprot:6575902-Pyramimonas_sp.AAC.1
MGHHVSHLGYARQYQPRKILEKTFCCGPMAATALDPRSGVGVDHARGNAAVPLVDIRGQQ